MSGCDVCLWGDTDIDNDFYSERTQRARKAYRCCECGGTIAAGDSYQRASGRSEGSIWTYKTCRLCVEIRRFGQLWEDMEQQAFDRLTTASECFRELSPEAKAMTLDRWIAWKFRRPQ